MKRQYADKSISAKIMIIGMVLLMVASVIPFNASGNEDKVNQYTTLVLGKAKEYNIGDRAEIEIHFFDKDKHVDAAEINITLGDPEWSDGRYLEVDVNSVRTDTGIYHVQFTIEEDDTGWWTSLVVGAVSCFLEEGGDQANGAGDNFYLSLETEEESEGFRAKASVDEPNPKPGDTIRFSLVCTNNGQKVDPDEFKYGHISVNENSTDIEEDDLTKDGTGRYHYDYTIPMGSESRYIIFEIYVKYQDDSDWPDVELVVDFYQVWLNTQTVTKDELRGQLGVCTMDGSPVVADIYLQYDYRDENNNRVEDELTGTTNEDGLMPLKMNYANRGDDEDVSFYLWANGSSGSEGDHQQYVSDYFYPDDEGEDAPDEGFVAVPNTPFLEPNSKVKTGFTFYEDGSLLTNTEINYYVYQVFSPFIETALDGSMGKVLKVGKATTDNSGKLTLTVETPGKNNLVGFLFKADRPSSTDDLGNSWSYDRPFLHVFDLSTGDDGLAIQVKNFGLGKTATVTLTQPGISGGKGSVTVTPVPSSVTDFQSLLEMDDDFESWEQLNEEISSNAGETFTGQTFTTELGIPGFFPEDMHFLIMGNILVEGQGNTGDMGYLNLIVVDKNGKINGDDDSDDFELLGINGYYMIAGFATLGVLAFAGVFYMTQIREKDEEEEDEDGLCPYCYETMEYFDEHEEWYCYSCESYHEPMPAKERKPKKVKVNKTKGRSGGRRGQARQAQAGRGRRPQQNLPACQNCYASLTYLEEYDRWYCYECERYAEPEQRQQRQRTPAASGGRAGTRAAGGGTRQRTQTASARPREKTGESKATCSGCGRVKIITVRKRPLKLRCKECGKINILR